MTNTLPKLSTRPDRPVDPLLIDILRWVDVVAREQGIDYFVGGALARDLILLHVFGKDTGRATRDVDLGICIDNWGKLDTLKARLIQGGNFTEQLKFAHRLIYRATDTSFGTPLDLLPFGGVESADATIAWPPGMDIVMNVAGFSEARTSALLQATDFDPEMAGAMLLGKDAAAVCLARTAQSIESILTNAQLRQRLIDQILRATLSSGDAASSSRVERYLDAFHRGFGPPNRP